MKLLFDQNISPKILNRVKAEFSESAHVVNLGLQDARDLEIFYFARREGYAVVSFDSDFVDLSILYGPPPKIVWIRTRNQTTASVEQLLRKNIASLHLFLSAEDTTILEIMNEDY